MLNSDIEKLDDRFERYRERITNFSNEFEFGLFLYLAKGSLKWAILILIGAAAMAFFHLRYTPNTYQSSSTIQLEKNQNNAQILDIQKFSDNSIASRLEFLRSRNVFINALKRLPLEISYFSQGNILDDELYGTPPFRIEMAHLNAEYLLNQKIYIEFTSPNSFILSYPEGDKVNRIEFDHLTGNNIDEMSFDVAIYNYERILELQKENELYFVYNDPSSLVDKLHRNLTVSIVNSNARTISVSFTDGNPRKAKDICEAVIDEFIQGDLEQKSKSAESVLTFINNQLDSVYSKLSASELTITTYRKDNRVASDLDNLSESAIRRLSAFEESILELELEEARLTAVEEAIKDDGDKTSVYKVIPVLAGTSNEGVLSDLITRFHELLLEKEEKLYTRTPESELIQSLDYQIDIQRTLIVNSVSSIKAKVVAQKEELQSKLAVFEVDLYDIPSKEIEFQRLERIVKIHEQFYTLLLEKKAEFSISRAGFVTDVQLLSRAKVAGNPLTPVPKFIIATYFFIAIVVIVAFLILRYLLHNTITSLNEISKMTQASVGILGIVPKIKTDIPTSQLLIDKNPKSLVAESFRTIRSNLQFISNEKEAKTIAVTSTISGEGKTFIAINLAGILAFSGKKVIVLDLDMRKPKIHFGFGVDNVNGMSTLLIEKDTIDNCINKSDLENLHFITAGPIPPNPSELIINGRLDEIINELKKRYDMVVVDNPPVGLVTDGISIIKKADYPLYIFRANYSKKNFVQNVDRLINESEIRHLSVILNSVDASRGNYGYNYGYGYGYGYSYGGGYNYYDDDIVSTRGKSWWARIFKRK